MAFLFACLLLLAMGMHRNNIVVGQRQWVSPQTGPCSSGSWSEEIQSEIPNLFHGIRSEYSVAKKDNFSAACPLEAFSRNGYYLGLQNRTQVLSRRRWISSNESCRSFNESEFLSEIRDRVLVFVGDSLMDEVYSTLICHLYGMVEMEIKAKWQYYQGGTTLSPPSISRSHFL
jgi:hypothetical protein